jgi:isoleucyl-tRNA synthetase
MPILPLLVHEVSDEFSWFKNQNLSISACQWSSTSKPTTASKFSGDNLMNWVILRDVLARVTPFLEAKRREKVIGSNLEAHVKMTLRMEQYLAVLSAVDNRMDDLADVFRVSQVTLEPLYKDLDGETQGLEEIIVEKAQGDRCARSWKILPDVGSDPDHPDLSARDAFAVRCWDKKNA